MAGTSLSEKKQRKQRDDEPARGSANTGVPYSVRGRLEAHRSGHGGSGERPLSGVGSAITRRGWDGVCAG